MVHVMSGLPLPLRSGLILREGEGMIFRWIRDAFGWIPDAFGWIPDA